MRNLKSINKKLILILFIAFFLRIVNISNNPPALYGDELTMSLDVNSIMHTGYDTTGKFLPLNFTMGGGRPVGYGYFSMPFLALFGSGALGIRLLSVLSGVGIVVLIYWLGRLIFSKQIGEVAAALLAISPWDLSLSRAGFETHFALFLSLFGIVMFLLAKKRPWFYIVSILSFGLSVNTYSTYKLTLPIFFPLLLWFSNLREIFSNKKNRIVLVLSTVILLLFSSLFLFQVSVNKSESRFLSINIFTQQEIKNRMTEDINERRNLNPLNEKLSKLLNNKVWEYGFLLGRNYLNNFSAGFLFLNGDRNPRHNMAGTGSLYIVELISIFFGIGYLFRKKYFRVMIFIVSLILLSPNTYSRFWAYPARIATEIAVQNKEKYNYIFLSDRIDAVEFAYPIYAAIEPTKVLEQNKSQTQIGEYKFKKYSNVYIGYIPDSQAEKFINSLEGSVLYIGPTEDKKYLKSAELINGLDGINALVLEKKELKI